MRIQIGREFRTWFAGVQAGGGAQLDRALALLAELDALPGKPAQESATFKRVRQARRHELWRVSHPFHTEVAVRLICWFRDDETVVVAVVGGDKKQLGNLWYDSATVRAEAILDQMMRAGEGR